MSQFNPGDLALTLINLGRLIPAGSVVELTKAIRPGDNLGTKQRPIIAIARGWFCTHREAGDKNPYAETSLMPLRGDFAPLEQKSMAVPA